VEQGELRIEKLGASSYSGALLVVSLAACYLGAATAQAIEHGWGLLKRVSHGDLTADGISSATFRASGLRFLCAVLGLGHTQPGRVRKPGAVATAVAQNEWASVPSLGWGCEAAFDLYSLALWLDP
jgi:hypothetical protein